MKRTIITTVVASAVIALVGFMPIGEPVLAQTKAQVADAALANRNAAVCDRYDLAPSCSDAEILAVWCEKNNKPSGAMCTASDTRGPEDRLFSLAQFYAAAQAADASLVQRRAVKARRATMALIEIAILDADTRQAVCTAAKIPVENCN